MDHSEMKALYISNILPPYRVDLCNDLHEKLDCRICHLSSETEGLCFSPEDITARSRFENFIIPSVKVHGKVLIREPESLISKDTRLVFVNEFSPVMLQILSMRRKYGFKVVSFCDDSIDMIRGNDFSRSHSLARRIVPRWLDEIIVNSPDVCKWYREKYGKGLVMPIIADDVLMRQRLLLSVPMSEQYVENYKLEGKKVILYVGRLVGLKNLPRLFEAVKAMGDATVALVVVGDGEERDALERLSSNLGLNTIFTGALYGERLLAWYNIADVLVLPSTREAFGAVTGEALTCGCRVMVSSRAGSVSLVREGENGLVVDPYDRAAMSRALVSLLDMPVLPRSPGGLRPSLLPVSFSASINSLLGGLEKLRPDER